MKKTLLKLLTISLLALFVVLPTFAQADSDAPLIDNTQAVQLAQMLLCIKVLLASLYAALESLLRLVPTAKSWSPLTKVIEAFEWLLNLLKVAIPDKTTAGDTHDTLPPRPVLLGKE